MTDRNFAAYIHCVLWSVYRSDTGSIVMIFEGHAKPSEVSVGSSPNVQELQFGPVGATAKTHYYYSCSIPPTYNGYVSYVHTYQIVEND